MQDLNKHPDCGFWRIASARSCSCWEVFLARVRSDHHQHHHHPSIHPSIPAQRIHSVDSGGGREGMVGGYRGYGFMFSNGSYDQLHPLIDPV